MKHLLLSIPLLFGSQLMHAQSTTFCPPEATAVDYYETKAAPMPSPWINVPMAADSDPSSYASINFLSSFGYQAGSITFNLATTVPAGCSVRLKVGTSVGAGGAYLRISTDGGQIIDLPAGSVPSLSGDYVGDTGPSDSDGFVLTTATNSITVRLGVLGTNGGNTYSGDFYVYDLETNCNCTVLPVNLVSFTAINQNGYANLSWSTSAETNNKGFEIQKSKEAKTWNAIGFVPSESTNSTHLIEYAYTDETRETGLSYYRLKQTDTDGSFSYSPIRATNYTDYNEESSKLTLGANPAAESINLDGNLSHIKSMKIADAFGRILISNIAPKSKIDIGELPKGVYLLLMDTTTGGKISKRFVKE